MAARTSGDQLLGRPEHLKARLVGADHVEVMRRDIGHRSRRAQLAVQRERALDVSRMGGIQDDPGTAGGRVDGGLGLGQEGSSAPNRRLLMCLYIDVRVDHLSNGVSRPGRLSPIARGAATTGTPKSAINRAANSST